MPGLGQKSTNPVLEFLYTEAEYIVWVVCGLLFDVGSDAGVMKSFRSGNILNIRICSFKGTSSNLPLPKNPGPDPKFRQNFEKL